MWLAASISISSSGNPHIGHVWIELPTTLVRGADHPLVELCRRYMSIGIQLQHGNLLYHLVSGVAMACIRGTRVSCECELQVYAHSGMRMHQQPWQRQPRASASKQVGRLAASSRQCRHQLTSSCWLRWVRVRFVHVLACGSSPGGLYLYIHM